MWSTLHLALENFVLRYLFLVIMTQAVISFYVNAMHFTIHL